jgi:F-type H+-transporting ATPase subunit c
MANGTIAIAAAALLAIVAVATAVAQGLTASKAMDAIARQPEAAGGVRGALVIALALMEALTIYAMLVAFMLVGKIVV